MMPLKRQTQHCTCQLFSASLPLWLMPISVSADSCSLADLGSSLVDVCKTDFSPLCIMCADVLNFTK